MLKIQCLTKCSRFGHVIARQGRVLRRMRRIKRNCPPPGEGPWQKRKPPLSGEARGFQHACEVLTTKWRALVRESENLSQEGTQVPLNSSERGYKIVMW